MSVSLDMIVGARGFLHPRWWGLYYPDDLPEEWRLPFYCNEHRGLLIPFDEWSQLDPEFWPEALENDLECILEWPGDDDVTRLRTHAEAMGANLKGVVQWGGEVADAPPLDIPFFAVEETAGAAGLLWQGPGTAARPNGGVAVGLVDGGQPQDPQALRSLLEGFHGAVGEAETAYLFLGGQPPHPKNLEDVRTLVDLLGYGAKRRVV